MTSQKWQTAEYSDHSIWTHTYVICYNILNRACTLLKKGVEGAKSAKMILNNTQYYQGGGGCMCVA